MDDLHVFVEDHVGHIVLDRPSRKNAFTMDMLRAWADAIRQFQTDDDVRVVVLRSTGDAFCSGMDLGDLDQLDRSPLSIRRLMTDQVHQVARAVEDLTKPLVAAVQGAAVGAGLDMALMCDYRIGTERARMSEGYVRAGLVPGDGGCFYLPRIVGPSRALRMLWTGEFVTAEQALSWGLFDELCSAEDLHTRLLEFAHQLVAQPPAAVQMIKTAVRQSATGDLRSALDLIASHQAVAMSTHDSLEALASRADRRPPVFKGR